MSSLRLLTAFSLVGAAFAWGQFGHTATGSIAQSLMSSNGVSSIETLLGGHDLGEDANWADVVKFTTRYKYTYSLHFVNTPDWACDFNYDRDCGDDECLVGAITNFTAQIKTEAASSLRSKAPSEPPAEDPAVVALRLVDHFVGDLHQPLHVGFTSDKGGNTIKGKYYTKSDNLHQIWDEAMIQSRITNDFSGSFDDWTASILKRIQTGDFKANVAKWTACKPSAGGDWKTCVSKWASESLGLACTAAYVDETNTKITSGFELEDPYYTSRIQTVEEQIAKGGVRLSYILNSVFAGSRNEDRTYI